MRIISRYRLLFYFVLVLFVFQSEKNSFKYNVSLEWHGSEIDRSIFFHKLNSTLTSLGYENIVVRNYNGSFSRSPLVEYEIEKSLIKIGFVNFDRNIEENVKSFLITNRFVKKQKQKSPKFFIDEKILSLLEAINNKGLKSFNVDSAKAEYRLKTYLKALAETRINESGRAKVYFTVVDSWQLNFSKSKADIIFKIFYAIVLIELFIQNEYFNFRKFSRRSEIS